MAVPTGVYRLENVKTRNWAVLLNDDDRSDVIAGTNADKDAGEKVSFVNLTNGKCLAKLSSV
jgi:hypothetical protein